MTTQNKKLNETLLFFLLIGGLSFFFFHSRINLFPSFIHSWSQSDRYALALGFLNNGFDFFHPQTLNLATINGITQVDFPIHEYLIALLMKITGSHEPIVFRLYILFYFIIGLYFLCRLTQLFGGTFLHGLFASFFILTAPVFLFYADGFIPSIPSFADFVIGCYFLFRYQISNSAKHFILTIIFFTLAALSRTPFAIFLVSLILVQANRYFLNQKINVREVKLFGWAFLVLIGYYVYNLFLKRTYGSIFLMNVLPADNYSQLKDLLFKIYTWHYWDYFSIPQYIAIALIAIATLLNRFINKSQRKPFESYARRFCLISFIGVLIYFFLMIKQFPYHDYYFIDSFYPVFSLWLSYSLPLIRFENKILKYSIVTSALVLIVFFISAAKENMGTRDVFHSWNELVITRTSYTDSGKLIDSLQIPRSTKILVLDANSTNGPLIQMNRTGYTVINPDKEKLAEGFLKPFDFVVVSNNTVANEVIAYDTSIVTRLEKVSDNGWINIYRKNLNPNRSVENFLGINDANTSYRFSTSFEDSTIAGWNNFTRDISNHVSGKYSFINDRTETSPLVHLRAKDIGARPFSKLLIRGKYLADDSLNVNAGLVLNHSGRGYYDCRFLLQKEVSGGWKDFMVQFLMPEIKSPNDEVLIYFANPDRKKFYLDDLSIVVYR